MRYPIWFIEEPTVKFPDRSECPVHKRPHNSHGWYVCIQEPQHRGEPDPHKEEDLVVYDHKYWGSTCSGFGGKLECQQQDTMGTGYLCGLSPWRHEKAKHRLDEGWINQMMRELKERDA